MLKKFTYIAAFTLSWLSQLSVASIVDIPPNTVYTLSGFVDGSGIVHEGATLIGQGTFREDLLIDRGATIAPGSAANAIGIISVNGNYTQNMNSIYAVDVNNLQQSDQINVEGTAILNSGIVEVSLANGVNLNYEYTILNTREGVFGTFQNVSATNLSQTSSLASPILIYTPTQAFLKIQTSIIQAANSANTKAVAAEIDSIVNPTSDLSLFLNQIATLTTRDAGAILKKMTGEQYSLAFALADSSSRQFLRRLYDPLRPIVTASINYDPIFCYDFDCYDSCIPSFNCSPITVTPWLEIGGGQMHIQGNRHVKGLNQNSMQVSSGLQWNKGASTIGIAGSYEHSHIHYRLNGKGQNDIGYTALYGLYNPSYKISSYKWYVLGDLAYGHTNNLIKRHVATQEERFQIKGDYTLNEVFGYIEGGFDLTFNHLLVQPFLGIEAGSMKRSKVKEKGSSSLNLFIKGKVFNQAYSRLGAHITTSLNENFPNKCAMPEISLSLDLAWSRRLNENSGDILTEKFQEFGVPFKFKGIKSNRNSFDYELTASINIFDKWQAFIEAVGACWGRNSTYNFLGGLMYSW